MSKRKSSTEYNDYEDSETFMGVGSLHTLTDKEPGARPQRKRRRHRRKKYGFVDFENERDENKSES